MDRRAFLAALATTAAGCTGTTSQSSTTSTTPVTTATTASSTTTTAAPDIRLVDIEAPDTVAYGEHVLIALTFENRGVAGSYVDTALILDVDGWPRTGAPVNELIPAGETVTVDVELHVLALGAVTIHLAPDQHVNTTSIQLTIEPATLATGADFTYSDGIRLAVTGFESPQRLDVEFNDGYYHPDQGRQYVLVDAVLENTGDWQLFAMNDLVLEAGGSEYTWIKFLPEHELGTVSDLERDMINIGNSLDAGASHTGGLWFDIPAEISLSSVRFGRRYKESIPVRWRP